MFDGTDLLNDFYKNKTQVLFRTLEYTDRASEKKVIDFGIDSFAPYYINGAPSKQVTVTYRLYEPSGADGINMVYGPLKSITVQPIIVDDSKAGKKRWSSQLPMEFTSTTSRANAIMQTDLFNLMIGGGKYNINYAATSQPFQPNFTKANVTTQIGNNNVTLTNIQWFGKDFKGNYNIKGNYNMGTFYGHFNPKNNNFICDNYPNINGIITSVS